MKRERDEAGLDVRGVAVTLICAALGLGIAFLVALQLQQWVDRAGEHFAAWKRGIEQPRPAAEQPARTIPSRDPAKANKPAQADLTGAFTENSYPPEALRRGEQGRTVADLAIDATGAPTGCKIVTSSGSRTLDEATCRIALQRIHYQPARDAKGDAVAGMLRLPVKWVIPE